MQNPEQLVSSNSLIIGAYILRSTVMLCLQYRIAVQVAVTDRGYNERIRSPSVRGLRRLYLRDTFWSHASIGYVPISDDVAEEQDLDQRVPCIIIILLDRLVGDLH